MLVNWWNLDQPTCQTLQHLGWQKAIYAQCFVQRIIVRPLMICGISCIQKRKHQFNLCCLPHGCYMDISYVATTLFVHVKICCLIQPLTFSKKGMDGAWLMPDKFLQLSPEEYTVPCGFKKKCSGRCKCQKSSVECTDFCKCSGKDC